MTAHEQITAGTGVGVDAGVGAGRDGRFFGFLLVAAFTTADATATVNAGSMDGSCMVLFLHVTAGIACRCVCVG